MGAYHKHRTEGETGGQREGVRSHTKLHTSFRPQGAPFASFRRAVKNVQNTNSEVTKKQTNIQSRKGVVQLSLTPKCKSLSTGVKQERDRIRNPGLQADAFAEVRK